MTILSLCFPCPISGSNISFECCCFSSWNCRLLYPAGLLIIPEAQVEGDVVPYALMPKTTLQLAVFEKEICFL